MSKVVTFSDAITSDTGASVAGPWHRVDGHPYTVTLKAPALSTLGAIQLSDDKTNVYNAFSLQQNGSVRSPSQRSTWVRGLIATDATGPRSFQFSFTVMKGEE